MKYLVIGVVFFALGGACGMGVYDRYIVNNTPSFKGDFKWEKGVRGELGKSGHENFMFKEAHFKIPDEYHLKYDSIQIILGWDKEPLVNFCNYKDGIGRRSVSNGN